MVTAFSAVPAAGRTATEPDEGGGPGNGVLLLGLAVLAPDDVWASGAILRVDHGAGRAVVLHWDGSRWSRSLVMGPFTTLTGMSASGPDDVWAVGGYYTGGDPTTARAVTAHWDGHRWRQVSPPVCSPGEGASLLSVAAVSPKVAWAVGLASERNERAQPLAMRADGGKGTCATLPPVGPRSLTELTAVTAAGADDVQAAGATSRKVNSTSHSYVLQWDGRTWSRENTPNQAHIGMVLKDIASCGAGCAWAVAYQVRGQASYPLLDEESGGRWRLFPVGPKYQGIKAVTAINPHDAWFVGDQSKRSGWSKPMALHWDGSQLTPVHAPVPTALSSSFNAAGAAGPRDIWAIGSQYSQHDRISALAEQWNGRRWRIR
jgi:hypothetical protein